MYTHLRPTVQVDQRFCTFCRTLACPCLGRSGRRLLVPSCPSEPGRLLSELTVTLVFVYTLCVSVLTIKLKSYACVCSTMLVTRMFPDTANCNYNADFSTTIKHT